MATHRITLSTVGAGISSTLDLFYYNGSAWVSHTTGIPTASLQAGYVFEDNTGATSYKVVDNGVCGTEVIFNCDVTTTVEATTTELPTTTETPTTTEEATTTVAYDTFQARLSALEVGHCSEGFSSVYVAAGLTITTGVTVYSDTGLTTPVSASFISEQSAGDIYNIAVGVVGADTGNNC